MHWDKTKCDVIIMRGKRKGEPCGRPVKYKQKENNYTYEVCGLHYIQKNDPRKGKI